MMAALLLCGMSSTITIRFLNLDLLSGKKAI